MVRSRSQEKQKKICDEKEDKKKKKVSQASL